MKEEMNGYTGSKRTDSAVSRRKFLNYAGLAGAGLFITSCRDKEDDDTTPTADGKIDLGSGDIGVMNFALAIEQLASEFYIAVTNSFYNGITQPEKERFLDLRDHELAHREFLRNVLGKSAIPNLLFDFSSVDFSSKTSVLEAAGSMEDICVLAYNGAAKLINTPDYLLALGKIASVEARHAAYLREQRQAETFSATTDTNGMDGEMPPPQILALFDGYFKTKVSSRNLPTD